MKIDKASKLEGYSAAIAILSASLFIPVSLLVLKFLWGLLLLVPVVLFVISVLLSSKENDIFQAIWFSSMIFCLWLGLMVLLFVPVWLFESLNETHMYFYLLALGCGSLLVLIGYLSGKRLKTLNKLKNENAASGSDASSTRPF